MNNLESLEEGIIGLNIIKFRAVLGKTQGKLNVCPGKRKATGRLLGVDILSPEEMRTATYVVDENTNIDIYDGFELNMDDYIDRKNWQWIKYLPELVPTLEDSYSTPLALFYIENLNKDTEDRIKKRNIKKAAFKYLENASQSKMSDICRILGTDSSFMSKLDLEDYLGELADVSPSKIVDAFEDKLIKVKLFLYALLDKKIVKREQDGVHTWGTQILGINEESALRWLQNSENSSYVARLYAEAYPAPQSILNEGTGEIALPTAMKAKLEEQNKVEGNPDVGTKATLDSTYAPEGTGLDDQDNGQDDPVLEQVARDKYLTLFGRKSGNMNLDTVLQKIAEKEAEGTGK